MEKKTLSIRVSDIALDKLQQLYYLEEERKKKYAGARGGGIAAQTAVPQKGNFEERKYDEAFLESFYQDDSGGKK